MKNQTRTLYNKVLSLVLLILTAIYLIVTIWQHQKLYTKHFNADTFKRMYEQSQWRDPYSKKPIGDDALYAYAGYRYIHGENPILINPEVPPAGKYLIGLSIVLTGNERIMSLVAGLISLYVMYLTTRMISKSDIAASLAVFLTSTHSLFTDQLIHAPQLDIFQLMFFLLFVYVFLLYLHKQTLLLLLVSGVVLGLFMSVKLAFAFLGLLDLCLGIYYIKYEKDTKKMIKDLAVMNIVALMVFTANYAAFFIHGGTLRSFLGTQKWIYLFYSTSKIEATKVLGSYLGLILTNSWKVWSTGYPTVRYDQWFITWPILFIAGIVSSIWLTIKNRNSKIAFLFIFICIYNIFLFAVPVFPRYLLLLYAPLHIMISIACVQIITTYEKNV